MSCSSKWLHTAGFVIGFLDTEKDQLSCSDRFITPLVNLQSLLERQIHKSPPHSNNKWDSALDYTEAPVSHLQVLFASKEVQTNNIHSIQPVTIPSGSVRPSQQYGFWNGIIQQRSILPSFGMTLWPPNGSLKPRLMGTPSSVIGWESGFSRSSSSSHPSAPRSKVSSASANSFVLVSVESPQKFSVSAWMRTEKRRARMQFTNFFMVREVRQNTKESTYHHGKDGASIIIYEKRILTIAMVGTEQID